MRKRLVLSFISAVFGAVVLALGGARPIAAPQSPAASASNSSAPCAGDTQSMPPQMPEPTSTDAAQYIVGKSDTMTITLTPDVVQGDTCSRSYTVNSEGKINFCMLGPVKVEGLSERGIEDELKKEFIDRGFLPNPNLAVQVTGFRSQSVTVNGAVITPGEISLAGDEMTLTKAIRKAQGFSQQAGPEVTITRTHKTAGVADATPEKYVYATKLIRANELEIDPPLQNGDEVFVSLAEMFGINGEVKSGGQKTWEPCMTVGDAISMSGGLTDKASLRRSYITRKNARGGYDRIKNLKDTTPIFAHDTLVIEKSLF